MATREGECPPQEMDEGLEATVLVVALLEVVLLDVLPDGSLKMCVTAHQLCFREHVEQSFHDTGFEVTVEHSCSDLAQGLHLHPAEVMDPLPIILRFGELMAITGDQGLATILSRFVGGVMWKFHQLVVTQDEGDDDDDVTYLYTHNHTNVEALDLLIYCVDSRIIPPTVF